MIIKDVKLNLNQQKYYKLMLCFGFFFLVIESYYNPKTLKTFSGVTLQEAKKEELGEKKLISTTTTKTLARIKGYRTWKHLLITHVKLRAYLAK